MEAVRKHWGRGEKEKKTHCLSFLNDQWKGRFELCFFFEAVTSVDQIQKVRMCHWQISILSFISNFKFPKGQFDWKHQKIFKPRTVGHIYQSDYSDADWINRISMAAKSNNLIPRADICQLHCARLSWELTIFFPSKKNSSTTSWFSTILSPCQSNHTLVLWLAVFLALGDFTHHLWSHTHSHTHTHMFKNDTEITRRSPNNSCGQFTQNACWLPSLAPASS